MRRLSRCFTVGMLVLGIVACSKEAPPPAPSAPAPAPQAEAPAPAPAPAAISVSSVALGNALNAEKRVQQAMETFAKSDTIYAVVDTQGAGEATLKAKWTYHKGDQVAVVNESTQTIKAEGPAASEFHVSKPDGWPVGDYQVEISQGEKVVETKKFSVK